MKQWAIDALNHIQDNWMDQKKVAMAYSRYITSKAMIIQEIATAVSLISSLDIDVTNYYDNGITTDLPNEVLKVLDEYGNSILVTNNGEIASIKDFFIQISKDEETDIGLRPVNTVSGNSVTVDDVLISIGDYVNNSTAISTALETLGKSTEDVKNSVSDYLTTLKAKLGSAYDSISSNALSYWDIINSTGSSMKDKVSTMLSSVTSCVATIDDRLNDDNATFNVTIDDGAYTGASVVGAWATSSSNVFSTIWNAVKTTTKIIVGAVGGLLKAGAKFIGKLWNRYIKPVYSPNDFVINNDYDEDYFQFPLCQFIVTKDNLDTGLYTKIDGSTAEVADLLQSTFGNNFNNFDQFFLAVPLNTGVSIETSFGMISLSHVEATDSVWSETPKTCLQLQIFLRPSAPISNPELNSCLVFKPGDTGIWLTSRSLHQQFDLLFGEDYTSNVSIDTDKKAINALLASRWRMLFFIGILASAYILDDDVWDHVLSGSDYLYGISYARWLNNFGICGCSSDTISNDTCAVASILASSDYGIPKFDFNGEPSNLDFCQAIAGDTNLNIHGSRHILGIRDDARVDVYCMMAMWVMGNSYEVMKAVYASSGQFPVFVPYSTRVGFGSFHYTLNTDEENLKAATNIATVIVSAITVAAIAVSIGLATVSISKALLKKSAKVSALNLAYQQSILQYGVDSQESQEAFNNWYKAKRSNYTSEKIAGLFGVQPRFSVSENNDLTNSKSNNDYGKKIIALIH